MKKCIFCLLMFFCIVGGTTAQTVNVADVEALPGETVTATLNLSAPANTYTGTQFALQFPATGFSLAASGAATGWPGSIEYGTMTAGKVRFAAAAGSTFETAAIKVTFTVDAAVNVNEYDVTVTDIMFEGPNGKDAVNDMTFKVKVVSVHTVLLDETSTTAPENAIGVNVLVKRTIYANEWSTICLPFAMTADQIADAFPETEVQLGDFNDYEVSEDGESINVMFVNATAIQANHPYIIKVSNPVTEFTVEGVDIDPQEAVVDFDTDRRHRFPRKMVGTYVAGTVLDWGTLFLSGNKFWYSVGNTTMKGYRAYFYFDDLIPDFEDNYDFSRIAMTFADGTPTEISDALRLNDKGQMINDEVREVYDLQGRKVNPQLRSGVYVKNGKKVVIK